jgi:HD-like signal output (HDOD) protein
MESVRTLIEQQLDLPALPTLLSELNNMLAAGLPSMAEVAQLLGRDPNLAAGVLALVNSPLHPYGGNVDSLPRAAALVGVRELRSLALAAAAPSLVAADARFWRHGVCVGLLCRGLAEAARQRELDRFFVTGLLHDVGAAILRAQLPDLTAEAAARAQAERVPLIDAERAVIGFSHADLGGELMCAWKLAEPMIEAIASHHERRAPGEHGLACGIVYLANLLAHRLPETISSGATREGAGISDWERINVHPRVQNTVLAGTLERLQATEDALLVRSAARAAVYA